MTTEPREEDRYGRLARSVFGSLPGPVLRQLAAEAPETRLASGHQLYEPQVSVVARGLVRAFIADDRVRQVTVCYLPPGAALGVAHVAGRHYPTAFEAVVDSRLLVVGDARFAELRQVHPSLSWACAEELSARLDETLAELARAAFATLRQRLSYHLLVIADYAVEAGQAVHLGHLSAAVGSPREVVSRTLGGLGEAGVVHVDAAGVTVLDREALSAEAHLR